MPQDCLFVLHLFLSCMMQNLADTISFFTTTNYGKQRSAIIISSSSNKDTSISQTEWTSCLGVSKGDNLLNFS